MSSAEHNRRYYDEEYRGPELKGSQNALRDAPGAYDALRAGRQLRSNPENPDDAGKLAEALAQDFRNRVTDLAELPEEVPMPFAELESLLATKGVNLTQELNDQANRELNRGHITAKEIETYKAQFQTIYVRKEELRNLEPGQVPMLFVDNMTPAETAQKFIIGAGIGYYDDLGLDNFKRINHYTKSPRKNQKSSGVARLTFTPDITNLTPDMTGESADNGLEAMKGGKHFLQPQQWFELFRRGLEKAINELNLGKGKAWKDMNVKERKKILKNREIDTFLPDSKTWTHFPEWRNSDGETLVLYWGCEGREIFVDSWNHPKIGNRDNGERPSVG
jgi:hypothetical protein